MLLAVLMGGQARGRPLDPPRQARGREVVECPEVRVEYESKQKQLAEKICLEAEEIRRRVIKDLGLVAEGKIRVRLYASSAEFRKAVGAEKGSLTVGIAYSSGDYLEMDASGLLESPRKVLAHEITHVLLGQHLGSKIETLPLWLNEGLAQVESGPLPLSAREALWEAASRGSLPALSSLEGEFPDEEEAKGLAYVQSEAAVEFLRDRYGKEAISKLLGLLREGKGFDEAFSEAMGTTFPEFAGEWEELLNRRPLWEVLFRGGAPYIIWAVAALLVVYGFLRLRRRGRAKMKEWEEEERG